MPTTETGTGELCGSGGDVWLPDARYGLTIDHADIAGGLPFISGSILNPPPRGVSEWMVGTDAILRLEDGREWLCVLVDGGGVLRPRGE